MASIPERFQPALDAVRALAQHERYLAAYVFGSVAKDNPCPNLGHPDLWGYKVDLSFRSLEQVRELAEQQGAEGQRPPWPGPALIVFDKTGELHALQQEFSGWTRATASESQRHFVEFIVYHSDDKVHHYAREDPFLLNRQWWASSKNVLARLRTWDAPLAGLVERFVATGELEAKLVLWDAIVDHVLVPFGGRRPVSENNCTCAVCTTPAP